MEAVGMKPLLQLIHELTLGGSGADDGPLAGGCTKAPLLLILITEQCTKAPLLPSIMMKGGEMLRAPGDQLKEVVTCKEYAWTTIFDDGTEIRGKLR